MARTTPISRFWNYVTSLTSLQIVAIASIVLTILLLGVRQAGLLQAWELKAFDQLMQIRPAEEPDSRLLIVTITQEDIQAQKNDLRAGTSLSDRSLEQLLAKLESYKPRVIGLNIFRDFPVDAQYPELAKYLKNSDRFIASCAVSNPKKHYPGIAPPPEVPTERLGFANVAIDSGRVVRRHLLFMTPSSTSACTSQMTFSVQLAFRYLAVQGIAPKLTKLTTEEYLQLGTTVFKPLKTRSGGYQNSDNGGYQLLLNYRFYNSVQDFAPQVTLSQVLKDQLDPNAVENRVVLIGVTAPSANYFSTPYGQSIPGIVVHAQQVSQILSAVLDGRPLLWVWPEWAEVLWIAGWVLVGSCLTWKIRHPLVLGLSAIVMLGVLLSICLLLFTGLSGWVSVIASALALLSMSTVGVCLRLREFLAVSRVANVLSHCQTTSDIAAIANRLAWMPSPPPKIFGAVVPQFLEVSQGVRAAREATSSYRQYELLGLPINILHRLRDSLAFGIDAQQSTRLRSIAQRWLRILETAQNTLKEQAKQSAEIPQVYIAGSALDPESAKNRFKGRIDIFREIETLALSPQPPVLLLYGGRRTGKTSALKYLPQKVGSELVPLLIDLQGGASATTLKGLAEYLASAIIEAARQSRNLNLPYPDTNQLTQEPFLALQNWLGQIERTAPNKRFLLCLDEFERLSEVVETTRSRVPLNFFRYVLQHRRQWTLLFSGSHTLDELDSYWSDYLINTRSLRVSYLREKEARELIVQPIEEFPNIYESSAVDALIEITRCQPYLVQLMCSLVVDRLNRDKRRLATLEDVRACIPIAIETGGMYFRELWTSLAQSDRNLLRCLIEREIPNTSDNTALYKLIRKEVLEKTENSYRFQVPLVQTFIEQVVREA